MRKIKNFWALVGQWLVGLVSSSARLLYRVFGRKPEPGNSPYRDDRVAMHARIEALEAENQELQSRSAERLRCELRLILRIPRQIKVALLAVAGTVLFCWMAFLAWCVFTPVEEVYQSEVETASAEPEICVPGEVDEVCNGIDDDCDGYVDEGGHCDCLSGATRSCGITLGACTLGTQSCAAGSWGACSGTAPAAETCNAIDDDCDGVVDEDAFCGCLSGSMQPCGTDTGQCTSGTRICNSGVWSVCSGVAPVAEICDDGRDNNCDGWRDEGCSCVAGSVRPCGPTVGSTTRTQICVNGRWSQCSSASLVPTTCRQIANNATALERES